MLEHLDRHKGVKQKLCHICDKYFFHTAFYRHMSVQHPNEDKMKHMCTKCDKSFIGSGDFKKHERTHTGEKPVRCTKCNKSYSVAYNLKKHTHRREAI